MTMINKLNFKNLFFNSRKQIVYGNDESKKYFIKIQIEKNKNKTNDITKEYEIIVNLNKAECISCPKAYEIGKINKDDFYSIVDQKEVLDGIKDSEFTYILQEYIPDSDEGELADMLFSMIEQKRLGVYQGDIKPENLRFDSSKSICYIVDYDQAILLDKDLIELDNTRFIDFCSEYDKEKYGIGDWLRHFPQYTKDDVLSLFRSNALDLSRTTIFNMQNTTNTPDGMYHTISEKDIFIDAARTLDARGKLLYGLSFKEGEKVLDIGCNAGLLSMYLHDRGCSVTGVDNDSRIVLASKMISNILGKKINYYQQDLDFVEELETFDTIMLFSVFHHTRNLSENGIKVANSCSRIIIETRLNENGGKQPGEDGVWRISNDFSWKFNNLQDLTSFCETIFRGFKFNKNLGIGDKSRYILEFVKE